MSGETWTEYGVALPNGDVIGEYGRRKNDAEEDVRVTRGATELDLHVVGRTVTASEWLPVDGEGR